MKNGVGNQRSTRYNSLGVAHDNDGSKVCPLPVRPIGPCIRKNMYSSQWCETNTFWSCLSCVMNYMDLKDDFAGREVPVWCKDGQISKFCVKLLCELHHLVWYRLPMPTLLSPWHKKSVKMGKIKCGHFGSCSYMSCSCSVSALHVLCCVLVNIKRDDVTQLWVIFLLAYFPRLVSWHTYLSWNYLYLSLFSFNKCVYPYSLLYRGCWLEGEGLLYYHDTALLQ